MIKLKSLLTEVKFTKPNFEFEWEEAERYPNIFPNKSIWFNFVKTGKVVEVTCDMKIQNTDFCWGGDDELEPEKVQRVKKIVDGGKIELPIVMKHNGKYELIGGNTRLVGLSKNGLPTKAWMFEV